MPTSQVTEREYKTPADQRERNRQWRLKNLERSKELTRRWTQDNFERVREYHRRYYQDNKDVLKQINREGELRRNFGLSLQDYADLLKAQGATCAICDEAKSSANRRLAVDHCHKTGKVRGLLCDRCNRMIGYARDSQKILFAAADYLKGNSCVA